MSYILDALKKSETAQKSNNLRILTTEESALVEPIQNDPSFKRALMLITLSFVFLAVLVVLIWFLFTIKNSQVNQTNTQNVTQQSATTTQSSADNTNDKANVNANTNANANASSNEGAALPQDVSIAGSVSSNDNSSFESASQSENIVSDANLDVIDSDMPSALSQLEINVLSFAPTPSRRFVMLDNKTYKEGSELIVGDQIAKIMQIRQDGVVLEYQNNNYLIRP